MRLRDHDPGEPGRRQWRRELEAAADPPIMKGRVCGPDCRLPCPTCGRDDCGCMCRAACPEAPNNLTDDETLPIEPGILPLVFELKRLGLFKPFWSCEGHAEKAGGLRRPPTVWFYCDSMAAVRVLNDLLADARNHGDLAARWQVAVTYAEAASPGTAFTLMPGRSTDEDRAMLDDLRADVRTIAGFLCRAFAEKAAALLARA